MDNLSIAKKYLNQNKFQNAIDLLQDIINVNSCKWEAFFELGKAYMFLKDFNKAISNFRKSIEIEDSFWAELLLSKSLKKIGLIKESTKTLFRIKKSFHSVNVLENIDIEIVGNLNLLNKNLYAYKLFHKYSLQSLELKKNILESIFRKKYLLVNDKILMKFIEEDVYSILYSKDITDKRVLEEQMMSFYKENILVDKDKFYDYILSVKDTKDKLKHYNLILNSLETYSKNCKLESKPASLVVTLTNVCNIKCKFCKIKDFSIWNLSQNKIKEIINIMPYVKNISWLGGEIFLYKNFFKLFDNAVENDVKQEIVTNGLLDNNIIDRFIKTKTKLSISITSVHKKMYEFLHQGAKFNKITENLEIVKITFIKGIKNFLIGCMCVLWKKILMNLKILLNLHTNINLIV